MFSLRALKVLIKISVFVITTINSSKNRYLIANMMHVILQIVAKNTQPLMKQTIQSKMWNFWKVFVKSSSFKISWYFFGEKDGKEKYLKIKSSESVHVARKMARKSGRDNSAKILRNDSPCSVEHNEMTIRHLHPGFKDSCSQRRSKGRVYLQFLAVRAEKPTILCRLLATLKKSLRFFYCIEIVPWYSFLKVFESYLRINELNDRKKIFK